MDCGDKLPGGQLKLQVLKQLKDSNCLKFGEYKLKSGITSQVYIDMRETTMYPLLFNNIVKLVQEIIPKEKQFDDWPSASQANPPVAIVGVPYGVVPLASAVAYACKLAYYPLRKEVKEYGCKPNSKSYNNFEYIIIEDVISTGSSIIETIKKMENKKITDIIAIVNRELGGIEKLQAEYPHIRIHCVISLNEIMKATKI